MSIQRVTRVGVRRFTLDQLRSEHALLASAAREADGCIVVDSDGRKIFSLWIPQEPLGQIPE